MLSHSPTDSELHHSSEHTHARRHRSFSHQHRIRYVCIIIRPPLLLTWNRVFFLRGHRETSLTYSSSSVVSGQSSQHLQSFNIDEDLQNPFSDRVRNCLEYGGATFEILEADSEYFRQSLSTPANTEETHWTCTESKHCSRSILLDQTRPYTMPGGTSRRQNDAGREQEPDRPRNRPSSVHGDDGEPGSSTQGASTINQGSVPGSTRSTVGEIIDQYAEGAARASRGEPPLVSRAGNGGPRFRTSTERDQQQARATSQHVQSFIDQHHAAEDLDMSQHPRVTPSSDSGERSALFLQYMSSLQNSIAERQSRGEQGTGQRGDANVNVRDEVSAETEQAGQNDPEWQTTTHGSSDSDESTGLEMHRRG